MAMNTTITPNMTSTTILGPNYLDCQHQLTVDEFQGVGEVVISLSNFKLTVDLRGTKPAADDPTRRRRVTFGIRLISKHSGHWERETPMPDTLNTYNL